MSWKTWRIELRDAYDGPPKDLGLIDLIWTDPPVVHKTTEAIIQLREIWVPHLNIGGHMLFNKQNDMTAWYDYVEKQILEFSRPGDLIVDPFCGESTTGLAAIKNSRFYYGCDIEERVLHISQLNLEKYEYANR